MPLLSSYPGDSRSPLYPGGESIGPGKAIDPNALIKGLQDQATLKAKQWQSMTSWERPEMPELWEKGLAPDVGYLSNEFNTALSNIEEGIRNAGGNARYYLGTDAGKSQMRRAALNPRQMATMFREGKAYEGLQSQIQENNAGQELWMNDNNLPVLNQKGQPLTINDMMINYRRNDAYSPFYGGQRDLSQNITTFDDARKDVESYFNSVRPDTYGGNEITPGGGGVYQEISWQGFTSYDNVKRIMEANGGLNNNLSKSVMAGFSRGFNDSQVYDMIGQGYVNPETGQYTEQYMKDREQWIFNEVANVANEKLVKGHQEDTKIKRVPGTTGGSDGQGLTRWDQAAYNEPGAAGDLDPVSQVYFGTSGPKAYERTTVQDLRRYSADGNPIKELFDTQLATAKSVANATGEAIGLPTVADLLSGVKWVYAQDKDGTNDVVDLSKGFGAENLIVYSVGNEIQEHVKPAFTISDRGPNGKFQYGPMNMIKDEEGNMVIDQRSLGNMHPDDVDKINPTTNTLMMEILYPAEQFANREGYSDDYEDGVMKKVKIGKESWRYDTEIKPRFAGYGGTKADAGLLGMDADELEVIDYNGMEYVKMQVAVPFNSSHAGIDHSETYQAKTNALFNETQQVSNTQDANVTQGVINAIQQHYNDFTE